MHPITQPDYSTYIKRFDSIYNEIVLIDSIFFEENPSPHQWLINNKRETRYLKMLLQLHKPMGGISLYDTTINLNLLDKLNKHKVLITSTISSIYLNYLNAYIQSYSLQEIRKNSSILRNYSKLTEADMPIFDSLAIFEANNRDKIAFDTTKYHELYGKANKLIKDTIPLARLNHHYTLLDSLFPAPKADLLKLPAYQMGKPDLQKTQLALSRINTSWCRKIANDDYQKLLSNQSSIEELLSKSKTLSEESIIGDPVLETVHGAKLYTVDSINANKLLTSLINTYKNQALLIDIWGTWCGACLRQMPTSKELHEQVKDLPVQFVYLCTSQNSNIDTWKKKIVQYELSGTHLFVHYEIVRELMDLFSVAGFPSYILIDTNGNYKAGAIKSLAMLDKHKLEELIK